MVTTEREESVLYYSKQQLVAKAESYFLSKFSRCLSRKYRNKFKRLFYGITGPEFTERKRKGESPTFSDAQKVFTGHFVAKNVRFEWIDIFIILNIKSSLNNEGTIGEIYKTTT